MEMLFWICVDIKYYKCMNYNTLKGPFCRIWSAREKGLAIWGLSWEVLEKKLGSNQRFGRGAKYIESIENWFPSREDRRSFGQSLIAADCLRASIKMWGEAGRSTFQLISTSNELLEREKGGSLRPKVEADSSVVESNNWQVGDLGANWFSSPVAKERSNAEEETSKAPQRRYSHWVLDCQEQAVSSGIRAAKLMLLSLGWGKEKKLKLWGAI